MLLWCGDNTFGLQRRQQCGQPRFPACYACRADHQHAPAQGGGFGRCGHWVQAHHLGLRMQHRRHRGHFHRGDIQPQFTCLAAGGLRDVAFDQRRRVPDRRGKQQHIGACEQIFLTVRCGISRVMADDGQAHLRLKKPAQPTAICTGATNDANEWGCVQRKRALQGSPNSTVANTAAGDWWLRKPFDPRSPSPHPKRCWLWANADVRLRHRRCFQTAPASCAARQSD